MNETQKVIKYLAIGFAIFLIISILSGITMLFLTFANLFDDRDDDDREYSSNTKTEITDFISNLDIDLRTTSTTIQEGDQFKIETNNSRIITKSENGKLTIRERKGSLLKRNQNHHLTIYLPRNTTYDEVSIDSGAGRIDIEKLSTRELSLDLGAGEVEIRELEVLEEAEIDGGAGKFSIKKGTIHNLDLDMGVGKLELIASITGNSKIEAGVGEANINLLGSENDYKIKVNKGIGNATIDGREVSDNTYYGNGANYLLVDGGVGKINITFKNRVISDGGQETTSSEFTVQKYLKDTNQSFILIGRITSGSFQKNSAVDLLDENNNVITSTAISNRNPEIYEKEIDACNINEACAFVVENITEEQAKLVKKVVLK